ncbi:hypothetical protein [Nannocystis radixulma]|uniref:DUF1554 domain-containing protein n=1 Tax=Nannocystis radixulma TaxID=2995305 RepID=A0ABT5AZZ6_9BACT|nr:hypothetical protein [Nannocystis radixulma]MDC0667068.1 hypothetical protein [Nannocystis radixulma]
MYRRILFAWTLCLCPLAPGCDLDDLEQYDPMEARKGPPSPHPGGGRCGNSNVNNGEECDDGNNVNGDGCDTDCTTSTKTVFASSVTYSGNLGGLTGADAKCQSLARAANRPGTYKAWLSDDTGSPSTRMTQSLKPYTLVGGTVIATNWTDLTDGTLLAPINITETGGPVATATFCGPNPSPVWSDTTFSGTLLNTDQSCGNWTGSASSEGALGDATATTTNWTTSCFTGPGFCNTATAPIYCFQQ